MKKFVQPLIFLTILFMLVIPVPSLAQDSLVPCDNTTTKCDFSALMDMIDGIIKFILFKLAIPIAAIMFAYAGIKLVFSGGSSEALGSAKSIFWNTVWGLLLAAGAFLIIQTILAIFGFEGTWLGFIKNI